MHVIEPGHIYHLRHLDGAGHTVLMFVCREDGRNHEGTQNQEVLRALIDRVQHLDTQRHWYGNGRILHHLRMALVLHEARALERKTEDGKLAPETIEIAPDGHYKLTPND
jgi:hypothetical protein